MIKMSELETIDYPRELLPYGVFSTRQTSPRIGVRIGDSILDLAALVDASLIGLDVSLAQATSLNPLIDAGAQTWSVLRDQLLALDAVPAGAVVQCRDATMHLPIEVADYVDFYSSIEHATNLGRLFRPDSDPLLPNWRHIPIGYHGRAGTVVPSETPIARPHGQQKAPDRDAPTFGPSERLDIELELAAVLAGAPDSDRFDDPHQHLFGFALMNDWSARDIQAWEYQPLGPFLGKSFATSLATWVTPVDAVAPYWTDAPTQEPQPLDYLQVEPRQNLNVELTVELKPAGSAEFEVISSMNASSLYWTFAQQVAHMVSNGASVRSGDLIASGTISGPEPGQEGSLIERTFGGREPLTLSTGETRTFLENGDTIRLGGRLGGSDGPCLAECTGTIINAMEARP